MNSVYRVLSNEVLRRNQNFAACCLKKMCFVLSASILFLGPVWSLELSDLLPVKLSLNTQSDLNAIYKIQTSSNQANIDYPAVDLIVLDHQLRRFDYSDLRSRGVELTDGDGCEDLSDPKTEGGMGMSFGGGSLTHGDYVLSALIENAGASLRSLKYIQVRSGLDYLCVAEKIRKKREEMDRAGDLKGMQVVVSTVVIPTGGQHKSFVESVVREITKMGAVWIQASGNYAEAIKVGKLEYSTQSAGTTYAQMSGASSGSSVSGSPQAYRYPNGQIYYMYPAVSSSTNTISSEVTFTVSSDQTLAHVVLSWGKEGETSYSKKGQSFLDHQLVREGGIDLDLEIYDKDGELFDTQGAGQNTQVSGCINALGVLTRFVPTSEAKTRVVAGVEVVDSSQSNCLSPSQVTEENQLKEGEAIFNYEQVVLKGLQTGTYKVKIKLKNASDSSKLKGHEFKLAVYTPALISLSEGQANKKTNLKFNHASSTSEVATPSNSEIMIVSDLSDLASRGYKDQRSPDVYLPNGVLGFDDGFSMAASSFSTAIVAMAMLQKIGAGGLTPAQVRARLINNTGSAINLLRTFKDSPWTISDFTGYKSHDANDPDVRARVSSDYNLVGKTVPIAVKTSDQSNGVYITRTLFGPEVTSSTKRIYWTLSTRYLERYQDTETRYRNVQKAVLKTRTVNQPINLIEQRTGVINGWLVSAPVVVKTINVPFQQQYQDIQNDQIPYDVNVTKTRDTFRTEISSVVVHDLTKVNIPQYQNATVQSGYVVSDLLSELPEQYKKFLESSKNRGETPKFYIGSY